MKKPKPKKCKECGEPFSPFNSIQKACSSKCAIDLALKDKAKKAAREHGEAKRAFKLNDKKTQRNLAQKYFNRFIRLRDAQEPCISCGTTADVIYAAGHYRTRGSSPHLAFDEDNVHKQCNKRCNLELSGNIGEFRIGLIKKIGIDRVERIESNQEPVKYSAADYVEMKKKYLKLCNEMTVDTP